LNTRLFRTLHAMSQPGLQRHKEEFHGQIAIN
jgi:hypothetical protein